jgi:hypothetical protein
VIVVVTVIGVVIVIGVVELVVHCQAGVVERIVYGHTVSLAGRS